MTTPAGSTIVNEATIDPTVYTIDVIASASLVNGVGAD